MSEKYLLKDKSKFKNFRLLEILVKISCQKNTYLETNLNLKILGTLTQIFFFINIK